ncbi:hypothetical protein TNCT_622001, partial [Trichonephila clavata]
LGCLHSKLGVNVLPQIGSEVLQSNEKNHSNISTMDNFASGLNVPVSSTDSSPGRSKVALKPGHSLMDWIRFTNSGKDLSGTGGKLLQISPRELAKHNTRKDAWISLRGKVYNITHYLDYHPGGEDELMRGTGKDATDLFNQVHRWVNAESMLQKCYIGVLKKSWSIDVPKLTYLKHAKKPKKVKSDTDENNPVTVSDNICKETSIVSHSSCNDAFITPDKTCTEILHKEIDDIQRAVADKSEWSISSCSKSDTSEVTLRFDEAGDVMKLQINCSSSKQEGLITDLVNRKLFVKINDMTTQILNIEFSTTYKTDYEVERDGKHFLKISLQTLHNITKIPNNDVDGSSVLSCQSICWNLCELADELIFWSCKLLRKIPVNHNTYLLTFLLPPGTKMWVPIGCHVHIKSYIEGVEIIRSYTPVISSLAAETNPFDESDGCKLVLMIKVYPLGVMTPIINQCSLGDTMSISSYSGSFPNELLLNCNSAIMLAAGTGITPMIRLIKWIITAKDRRRSILLLFFNKTEEDIIWREEFEKCAADYKEFQIVHILSESNEKWFGFSGKINGDLVDRLLTVKLSDLNKQIFICGPLPFNETAVRCLKSAGYSQDDIYVFSGS